jgi:hypothetical protein
VGDGGSLPQCIKTVIGVTLNKVLNSPQIQFKGLVDMKMCFGFAMGIHIVNGLYNASFDTKCFSFKSLYFPIMERYTCMFDICEHCIANQ